MDDNSIIIEVLKVLDSYVKSTLPESKQHHIGTSLPSNLQARLLELSQGWGGKETGLSMIVLCDDTVSSLVTTRLTSQTTVTLPLYFDFFRETKAPSSEAMVISSTLPQGQNVINLSYIEHYKEDAVEILQQLVSKFAVPTKYHPALFSRIRLCKAFPDPTLRKQFIYIRLLAFNVLGIIIIHSF
jgi:hypothetical protein